MNGRTGAAFAVVVGAATWGTTGTSQAIAALPVSPLVVGAARTVGGALALGLVVALAPGACAGTSGPRTPRGPLLVAGASIVAYQLMFFVGVDRAGVAVGTVVGIGSVPLLTGLLVWVVDRVRPSGRWWVATVLAIAGCAAVVAPSGAGTVDRAGVVAAVGAGAAYAVLTVAGRRLLDAGVPPTLAMQRAFAVAAVPSLAVAAVVGVAGLVSPRGLALVLWLAVVTVAVGYVMYARGLQHLSPPVVGTLTLAEPLVAAVLGVLLLAERPSVTAAVGAAALVAGLVVVSLPGRPRVGPGRHRETSGRRPIG